MSDKPAVLFIDDEGDSVPLEDNPEDIRVKIRHPEDLEKDDLEPADLVILDYRLGNWWPKETPFACRPSDGLALMAVISAHLRRMIKDGHTTSERPTALALISGHLEDLAHYADLLPHPHLVARAHGLDWAFRKEDPALSQQVHALARAVHALPRTWPDAPEDAARQLHELLAIEDKPWTGIAWSDVLQTTPPLYELSRSTDGVAILRWLLHRILPYPTFLWSTHQLAARFRVRHTWLREQLETSGPLSQLFAPARYQGILAGFLGERWWGAGIDSIVWDHTGGAPLSIQELHAWLETKIGTPAEKLDYLHPVICLDESYQTQDELENMDECVRIMRDDWPTHASPPWIRLEQAREQHHLGSRVIEADRDRLDTGEDEDAP